MRSRHRRLAERPSARTREARITSLHSAPACGGGGAAVLLVTQPTISAKVQNLLAAQRGDYVRGDVAPAPFAQDDGSAQTKYPSDDAPRNRRYEPPRKPLWRPVIRAALVRSKGQPILPFDRDQATAKTATPSRIEQPQVTYTDSIMCALESGKDRVRCYKDTAPMSRNEQAPAHSKRQ
ncbi:hypothetical protein VTO73DRAFT_13124 [Trametes versicolor]